MSIDPNGGCARAAAAASIGDSSKSISLVSVSAMLLLSIFLAAISLDFFLAIADLVRLFSRFNLFHPSPMTSIKRDRHWSSVPAGNLIRVFLSRVKRSGRSLIRLAEATLAIVSVARAVMRSMMSSVTFR